MGDLSHIPIRKFNRNLNNRSNWSEWTMWSMAPLSRIQSVEQRWEVSTCEEKTKYSNEWQGNLGSWVENWVEDLIPDISCPWKSKEGWVMIVATWCAPEVDSCDACVPKWLWELSKLRNCWYSAWVRLKLSSLLLSVVTTLLTKEEFHPADPFSWTCI